MSKKQAALYVLLTILSWVAGIAVTVWLAWVIVCKMIGVDCNW